MCGLFEESLSNCVFGSSLNLPLSSEKSARSDLTLSPLSLFMTIVLNLRPSISEDDRVTMPSTRFGRSPTRPPSLTSTTPTLLSSGSDSIADSIIRRPSSLVFLRAPSQLSMTMRPLSLERFRVRTLLKTSSASDTCISADPSIELSGEVIFEKGSCISWIQGKCFRSLLGGIRAWHVEPSRRNRGASHACCLYPLQELKRQRRLPGARRSLD